MLKTLVALIVGCFASLALPMGVTTTTRAQSEAPTHYLLGRPLPASATVRPDMGFPYGWHRNNRSPIHHGMDYQNRRGTPVIAAGAGTVFYAGDDASMIVGPRPNFYGNVIILQHDFSAPEGGAVFTLYGHLYRVGVTQGQRVNQGDVIGQVGSTGIAIGSHLHFEVRVGDPANYYAVRNPELWYPPLPGRGKLIGRMVDASGAPARGVRFVLATASLVLPSFTYAEASIPVDPQYNENFVMGDLSAGCYRFRVRGGAGYAYDEPVCIQAGQTLFLEVRLKM
jgi:murein DD-endopeptidase MepM/ murein hydrolase activator NlpD